MFDRFNICEAYSLYDENWGPTPYGERLYRLRFRRALGTTLESATPEVKLIYGRLVREHNRLYVAYERYARRNPAAKPWPGTQNMRGSAWDWLKRNGLLPVIDCYV